MYISYQLSFLALVSSFATTVATAPQCFSCVIDNFTENQHQWQIVGGCGEGVPVGYYPDLTTCHAYCFCTGSIAPASYQICNHGLVWDTWLLGVGATHWLAGDFGDGGLYATNGGGCQWDTSMSAGGAARPGCGGNAPKTDFSVGAPGVNCAAGGSPTASPVAAGGSPTASPVAAGGSPTASPVAAAPGGGGTNPGVKGDPHFRTWAGEHFEYHGKCDLELLSDPSFADGKGIDVHARTEIIRSWSFVKKTAIRIGSDVLEVEGSKDDYENHYWINDAYLGDLTTFGGFPISFKQLNKKAFVITIDLQNEDDQTIIIRTYREWVRVEFMNANERMYGNTIGILGNFATGIKLARDGITGINNYNKFGQEWQVRSTSKLFREEEGPQYPETCVMPTNAHAGHNKSALRASRRLTVSVSETDAEDACAYVADGGDRKECIYDVLATEDVNVAGAY